MVDIEQIKSSLDLEAYCEAHLERDNRGRGSNYVCPACKSGDKVHGTSAFHIYRSERRWFCFSCHKGGDIIDLVGIVEGIEDKGARIAAAAREAGIADSKTAGRRGAVRPSKAVSSSTATNSPRKTAKAPQGGTDEGREKSRRYIDAMRANLHDPEAVAYLEARGFTLEDAEALGIGYDPHPAHGWTDAAGAWHRTGRIILPWRGSDYYHIDRAIDGGKADNIKYDKPDKEEVGAQPVYNLEAIKSGRPFFIVEGVLDAMAVELAGYEAVALGSTDSSATYDAIAAAIEDAGGARCIIMLDNPDIDEPGRKAADKLAGILDDMDVAYVRYSYHGGAKDAADELKANRAAMPGWYAEAVAALDERAAYLEATKWDRRKARNHLYEAVDVAGGLFMGDDVHDPIPTGLKNLDDLLDGGLPSRGLVIVGAMSSAGKTTLMVQVADHIAENGRPVLFVTLEQGKAEIVAKSLSRIASAMPRLNGNRIWLKVPDLTTTAGREGIHRDAEKEAALMAALERYTERIAPRFIVYEADERPTMADLEDAVKAVADHHGAAPVVVIDYLQIIAPMNDRATDKQAVDYNVSALRKLARDYDTCVLAISTLNRSSYNAGGIAFESFKESGGIEYAADVLLGLQPRGLKSATADEVDDKKIKAVTRKALDEYKQHMGDEDGAPAEIVLLKNRGGAGTGKTAAVNFCAPMNTFKDARGVATQTAPKPKRI